MSEFESWLTQLGLERYLDVFVANDVDLSTVAELTEEDLKELGLTLGHRRALQKGIRGLARRGDDTPAEHPAASNPGSDAVSIHSAWERRPGERKPVTMLFADITGSTALTESLDAEETHDLLYGATQRMCAAVEANRGTVCRFMGDGVMAMFGAPIASEHHAVEACEAALAMQDAIGEYSAGNDGLRIRVGIHSGEVVVLTVGEGDKLEFDASGPTVPIAARMEQTAAPGTIYITGVTRSLAGDRLECAPLPPVSVKGVSQPVEVHVLRRIKPPEQRSTARTAFVGRKSELGQFRGLCEACVSESHGQTIYLRGEPGIGKTRLVEEFSKIAARKGMTVHRGLILPFGVRKGHDAVHSLVRSLLRIPPDSGKAARRQAARAAIDSGLLAPVQGVYLNDLLDLAQPLDQRAPYDAMDNTTRSEGKQAVVCALARGASIQQPIVVIVEDVHWADKVTLSHLSSLSREAAESALLLVMTSRTEGDQIDRQWLATIGGSPFLTMELGPLRNQDAMTLVEGFIGAGNELADDCLARASGNPLFLEQLLRSAREGVASLPDSIQSLVLARVDRLPAKDKKALQAAAVVGQHFTIDVLRHVSGYKDFDCSTLIEHGLVRPDHGSYLFSHALIQESVYSSLLRPQREALHRSTAEWFAGSDLTLHAEHLGHAGDSEAPEAFLEAALEQQKQYRYQRALDLADRGLALLNGQGVRHGLTCLKAELLHDLGHIDSSTAVYGQALTQAEDDVQRCEAWLGMAGGLRVSTDYQAALQLIDEAVPVASRLDVPLLLSRLHHLRGNLCFPLGRIETCKEEHQLALEYAKQASSAGDEAKALGGLGDAAYARGSMVTAGDYFRQCLTLARRLGMGKVEAAYLSMVPFSRLYQCQYDVAREEALAAVEFAEGVGHGRAEINARGAVCHILNDTAEYALMDEHVDAALALCEQLGADVWHAVFRLWKGLVFLGRGDRHRAQLLLEESRDAIGQGIAFVGGRIFGPLAFAADDPKIRDAALTQGEALLRQGSISHNHLYFYRYAMETMLRWRAWDRVEHYARGLARYTASEPLPWSEYFIARARALVELGRDGHSERAVSRLTQLRHSAERYGLVCAIPLIDEALAQR